MTDPGVALELRQCLGPDCAVTFRVLPTSDQRHCNPCKIKVGLKRGDWRGQSRHNRELAAKATLRRQVDP